MSFQNQEHGPRCSPQVYQTPGYFGGNWNLPPDEVSFSSCALDEQRCQSPSNLARIIQFQLSHLNLCPWRAVTQMHVFVYFFSEMREDIKVKKEFQTSSKWLRSKFMIFANVPAHSIIQLVKKKKKKNPGSTWIPIKIYIRSKNDKKKFSIRN